LLREDISVVPLYTELNLFWFQKTIGFVFFCAANHENHCKKIVAMKIPRIESLVLIFCFLAVVVWAVKTCNGRRTKLIAEREERPIKRDTVFIRDQAATPTAPQTTTAMPQMAGRLPSNPGEITTSAAIERTAPIEQAAPKPQPAQTVVKNQTTLFVTIDGLNLRREPGLKAETVAKLDLYEQVYFMNEKSDYTQEINLGQEMVTDYWVKVKTKSGKVGWVFGAGVHYYKQKRKGVLE
jgi:hypothetical protein